MYRLAEHVLSARCRKQMKKLWSSNDPQVVSSRGNLILPTYNNVRSLVEHHGFHWFKQLLENTAPKKAFDYMPSLEQINKTRTVWSQPPLTEVPPNRAAGSPAQVERVELPRQSAQPTSSVATSAQPTSSVATSSVATTSAQPPLAQPNSAQPPLSVATSAQPTSSVAPLE